MRLLRNRFLWGALGLAAGAWSLYVLREKNEQKEWPCKAGRVFGVAATPEVPGSSLEHWTWRPEPGAL